MRKKIFSLLIPGLTAMSWEGCPMAQVYSTELKTTEFNTIMGEEIELPVNIDIPISFEQEKALLEFQIENGQLQHVPFVSGTKVLKYKPTQIGVSSDLTLQVNNLLDPSLKQTHTFKVTTERAAFRATGRVDMLGNITIDMYALNQAHEEVLSKRQFQIILAPNAFTNAVGKVLYNNHPLSGHDRLGIAEVHSALKVADLGFLKQNIIQPQEQANLPTLTFVIVDRQDKDNKRHVSIDLTPMVSAKIDKQVTECARRSREIEGDLQKLNEQVSHPACFANLNEFALFKNQVLNLELSNNKLVETTLKLQSTYANLENTQEEIDAGQAINRLVSEDNVRRQQLLKPLLELVQNKSANSSDVPSFQNILDRVKVLAQLSRQDLSSDHNRVCANRSPVYLLGVNREMVSHLGDSFNFDDVILNPEVNTSSNQVPTPISLQDEQANELCRLRYLLLFDNAQLQDRISQSGWTPLLQAVQAGDVNTIKMLLAHPNTNVNEKGNYHATALHAACSYFRPQSSQKGNSNMLEVIRLLLSHKDIQVNMLTTSYPRTALDCLYEHQQMEKDKSQAREFEEVKELLIAHGAKHHKNKPIWEKIGLQ